MLTAGIEKNVSIKVPAVPIVLNERWSPISFFFITFTQFSIMRYTGSLSVMIDSKIVHDIKIITLFALVI